MEITLFFLRWQLNLIKIASLSIIPLYIFALSWIAFKWKHAVDLIKFDSFLLQIESMKKSCVNRDKPASAILERLWNFGWKSFRKCQFPQQSKSMATPSFPFSSLTEEGGHRTEPRCTVLAPDDCSPRFDAFSDLGWSSDYLRTIHVMDAVTLPGNESFALSVKTRMDR